MPRRRAAATWVLRPGWEPLPGIGAGPLSDAEMRARWDARQCPPVFHDPGEQLELAA